MQKLWLPIKWNLLTSNYFHLYKRKSQNQKTVGMKIKGIEWRYQKATQYQMCRKWPIYIWKVLLENHYDARFLFYRQSLFCFCTFRLIRFLYAVLHQNCCTPSIDMKPFPMNFWRNWHLFASNKKVCNLLSGH